MNRVYLFLLIFFWGCSSHDSSHQKHHQVRDNVVDVRKDIKEMVLADILIGGISRMYLFGDYLIVGDYMSQDKQIHIFDKNHFTHITSTGYKGQGPNEITNMGHIGVNETDRVFYVSDHGKQTISSFNIDSLLVNPDYAGTTKMRMSESLFPDKYEYINDTLCIGLVIEPIGNNDFKSSVAKWNMNTGEIKVMKYEHPEIKKKRITFAASAKHNLYVECYQHHDLMTICNLNGDLKYNIYGKQWSGERKRGVRYYKTVSFCKDKIIALYSGEETPATNEKGRPGYPTKFHVFTLDGDYLQTLETGHQITGFCYDEGNNRLLMTMDDEIQFGYLDLLDI